MLRAKSELLAPTALFPVFHYNLDNYSIFCLKQLTVCRIRKLRTTDQKNNPDSYKDLFPSAVQGKKKLDTHIPVSLSAMTPLLRRAGQITQSNTTVHIYRASSDLTREGDNTFISTPCHLAMWRLPLWRYSSIVAVLSDVKLRLLSSCFWGEEERSGRWRKRFLFNLDPPKWRETACWQACERSTAGSTGGTSETSLEGFIKSLRKEEQKPAAERVSALMHKSEGSIEG